VVLMPSQTGPLAAFKEQEGSDVPLVDQLEKHFRLASVKGSQGFGAVAYPLAFFSVVNYERYADDGAGGLGKGPARPHGWKRLDAEVLRTKLQVKGTTVTVNLPEGYYVSVRDLMDRTYSKPVTVNWFYERALVAAHADSVSHSDFWKAVASAVGAKYVETDEKIELSQDIEGIRKRMIASFEEEIKLGDWHPVWKANYRYNAEVLELIPAADFAKSLETARSRVVLSVPPTSPLFTVIRNRVRNNIRATESEVGVGGWASSIRLIDHETDWTKPAEIPIVGGNVNGTILQKKDPKGKIGF
jgi:hypothetical protein